MATAQFALAWVPQKQVPEELSRPAEIVEWQRDPQISKRVVMVAHTELEAELEHASRIIGDPEESEEVFSNETLQRAADFLRAEVVFLWQSRGIISAIPTIGPGPNGSVDLFWKNAKWELLANIPAGTKPGTYYGDDYGNERARGTFDPANPSQTIAAWLMK